MENKGNRKNMHLTIEEREEIQNCLHHGMTFKAIGRRIGKDPTTISKEVKRHITYHPATGTTDEAKLPCSQLLKAPYVCNPCQRRRSCRKEKRLYSARNAHQQYCELLVESRTGVALNKEQFYINDRIIRDGIRNGQHLYHILHSNPISVSQATVYRYAKKGYLSILPIDLPRAVKFKSRQARNVSYIPKAIRINRTFECFQEFKTENQLSNWVEMDTVIGRIGGKALLTFTFTFCNFMAGFLLDGKTAADVSTAVLALKDTLNRNGMSFGSIFPVLVTDNGGEFADAASIENDLDGRKEAHLFFCDPGHPEQKPRVEKGHTLLRDIVPKASSFDDFTQETVALIFSHINSVRRKTLNGKTPFEVFSFTFSPLLAALLGSSHIPSAQVVQSPRLLRLK